MTNGSLEGGRKCLRVYGSREGKYAPGWCLWVEGAGSQGFWIDWMGRIGTLVKAFEIKTMHWMVIGFWGLCPGRCNWTG